MSFLILVFFVLRVGQKQAELSQKKTSNIPGLINFNEGIYLKLQPQEL